MQIALKSKMCKVCFRINHKTHECKVKTPCKLCGFQHSHWLCVRNIQNRDNSQPANVQNKTRDHSTVNAVVEPEDSLESAFQRLYEEGLECESYLSSTYDPNPEHHPHYLEVKWPSSDIGEIAQFDSDSVLHTHTPPDSTGTLNNIQPYQLTSNNKIDVNLNPRAFFMLAQRLREMGLWEQSIPPRIEI